MSVEVIFLGTGDAFNSAGRANQSFWIKSDKVNFLIDCGPNTLQRIEQMQLDPAQLDGVLITHFHADHLGGISILDLALMYKYKKSKRLWFGGHAGLQNKIHQFCKWSYPGVYRKEGLPPHISEYQAGETVTILDDRVTLETFKVDHAPESLAYRIQLEDKIIAISGDTQWTDNLIPLAKDSDLFVCECFHHQKYDPPIGHLSYEELVANRDSFACKQMLLVHGGEKVLAKQAELQIPFAQDGQRVIL